MASTVWSWAGGAEALLAVAVVSLGGCPSDSANAPAQDTTTEHGSGTHQGDTTGPTGAGTHDMGSATGMSATAGTHGGTSESGSSSGGPPPPNCGDPSAGEAVDQRATLAIDCGFAPGCVATSEERMAALLTGPMTLVAELHLDPRPPVYAALLSRWDSGNGDRSWELGIDPSQQPYVWLSPDGSYAPSVQTYARPQQQLRLGETWEVAAVVVPGERIAMFIDGQLVREQTDVIESINPGNSALGVGLRPGELDGPLSGALGRLRIFDRALGDDEIASLAIAHGRCGDLPGLAPVMPITSGPKFHWFGYYDKLQFDPTDRYVLSMAVDFEDRPVTASDVVELGTIDLDNDNAWTTIGESRAWNWQQGAMLQWVPGADHEVIWNDREGAGSGTNYIARVLDLETQEMRTLSRAIFTVAPDGETALGVDFERYYHMLGGYGYPGIPDPNQDELAPDDAGIWSIDMASGSSELILSYAEVAAVPNPHDPMGTGKHFFYAVLANPSSSRFFFYDRLVFPGGSNRTRIFTANMDGSELFLLDDAGSPSHIDWRDDTHIVVYSYNYDGYALLQDGVGWVDDVLLFPANGHETFLPGDEWMVSDTYPDVFRYQHPFLYHVPGDEVFSLAHLFSPESYTGSDRCDNHPRQSRDGRRIVVDSPHDGGRQMYLIELGEILDSH